MPRGERLFRFLASLMLRNFYRTVTIPFQCETETRRMWRYKDLPEEISGMFGSRFQQMSVILRESDSGMSDNAKR